MSRRLLALVTIIVCVGAGRPAIAQPPSDDYATPAHVSVVQGAAVIERNGQAEALTENLPLLEGDRLRTESGRLEAILPDGSVVALDRNSTLDLLAGGLMRLLDGRMVFVVSPPLEGDTRRDYQVDAPAGMVRFLTSGEYRVSTMVTGGVASVELAVVRGEAVIDADGTSVSARAGQRTVVAEGRGVTSSGPFNSAYADAFYVWADGLRAERVGSGSNAYLPPDLQVYGGTFDRDGTWDNAPDYGRVWYPRVSADWRPYYDGGWQPYGWGWTWVGAGRWAWPTHHYGRWGHGARGWFWSPAAQWGPAWVSWGFATDYVGWCPLGFNDSPVFGLSFGFSSGSRYSPWLGWTVVPHGAFGRSGRVPTYALRGDHLRAAERSSFAVRRAGPTVPGMAVTRRWSDQPGSPYDRAQAVAEQRVGGSQGWATTRGGTPTGGRPNVAQRPWTDNPASPFGRAQAVAGERLRQAEPGAAARSRSYDTRPFASPSQTPLPYPDRFRSTVGPQGRDSGGAAVPRSQSSPSRGASAVPRPYSGARPSSESGRSYSTPSSEPRGYSGPSSSSPRSYSSPGPAAVPRSYSAPRSYSTPSSPAPRSYSAPGSGGGRPSAAPSAGGGRASGGAPARGGRRR